MKIITTLILLFLINTSFAQNDKPIGVGIKKKLYKKLTTELIIKETDKSNQKFEVYSYVKSVKFIVIKNSNPEFIKVKTSKVKKELQLGDTYGLYKNIDSLKDNKGGLYVYSRNFKLEFNKDAEKKFGTLSVYGINGEGPVLLLYNHETNKKKFKIDTIKIGKYDNVLYVLRNNNDTITKKTPFKFNSIQVDQVDEKKFTIVNSSNDTVRIDYMGKNRFNNYSWGSITPSIEGTEILPLSEKEFTLQLHPKKASIEAEKKNSNQFKTKHLKSGIEYYLDKTIGIEDGKDFNLKIRIEANIFAPKSEVNFISSTTIFYKANSSYFNLILLFLILLIIADYRFFHVLFKRPSIKRVRKYVQFYNEEQEKIKSPRLSRKWKAYVDDFISGSKNLSEEEKSSSYIKILREKNEKVFKKFIEEIDVRYFKDDIEESLRQVQKKFQNLLAEKNDLEIFKKGFYNLEINTLREIEEHILFIKSLSELKIKTVNDIEPVKFEIKKAETLDKLHQFLRNQGGDSIASLRNEVDLQRLKRELSDIILRQHTNYPAFVYEFTNNLEEIVNNLKILSNKISIRDSIFAKKIESVLNGRTGSRGFQLAYEISSDVKENGQLARRLELTEGIKFKDLSKQNFYQKFISSFKLEINVLCILYAYSQVTTVANKMHKEGIDIEMLKKIFNQMQTSLQKMGVAISIPTLFKDKFKEGIYEMAQDSTLIYHFSSEIGQLNLGIIYDLVKIGITTHFNGKEYLENVPKVLYKT